MSSSTNKVDLSIVIPALNEEKRIGKSLDELSIFLRSDPTTKKLACEVIVVSAKGHDNTKEAASKYNKKLPNFRVLQPGKPVGKGRDVQYGMLRTQGTYALFMDADLATPLKHIPAFYNQALEGYDVVIATRNLKKHHSHLSRRILSLTGNTAFRILGGVWIEDSQCGFKLFSQDAVKICFKKQTIMNWGFDMELLTIAKINKLNAKHIRISDWKDMPGGTFESGQILRNALETLLELLHIAKHRILRNYS